jgi:hypothetical protein
MECIRKANTQTDVVLLELTQEKAIRNVNFDPTLMKVVLPTEQSPNRSFVSPF